MAILLTMPALSPTMETGVITTWMKKVGDFIDVGEVLAEIETDKAVMEYEMPDEGYVREILVEPGQEINVGTPIAILAESMEEDISAVKAQAASGDGGAAHPAQPAPPAPQPGAASPAQAAAPGDSPPSAPPAPRDVAPSAEPAPSNGRGERIKISPYARKLAMQNNVDFQALPGSGPGGRIVARDIESAIAGGAASAPAAPAVGLPEPLVPGAPYEDLPLSMMRKAIARRLSESKATVPHFQLTRKIRAEALLAGREALKGHSPEVKITLNDIIVKACATALRQHPNVNSQFLGDTVRRFNTVDIAVAVGTPDGLITPVVRNADLKGLARISQEMKVLAAKAKDKKLTPEEYSGGTFTVSNLGM